MKGNDVRFLGFRNQTELPGLYDLADLFVLPSRFEPWGVVINEVMNAAKPVVVSACVGAAPDLVQPNLNGWIYPPGDVTALPQGHDAWVVGNEPVVVVDWYGASNYARG